MQAIKVESVIKANNGSTWKCITVSYLVTHSLALSPYSRHHHLIIVIKTLIFVGGIRAASQVTSSQVPRPTWGVSSQSGNLTRYPPSSRQAEFERKLFTLSFKYNLCRNLNLCVQKNTEHQHFLHCIDLFQWNITSAVETCKETPYF